MKLEVSYGKSRSAPVRPARLDDILNGIKSGKWKTSVLPARQKFVPGMSALAKAAKNALPIFSTGRFSPAPTPGHTINRTNDAFVSARAVIIDIDHCATEDEASQPDDPFTIQQLKGDFGDRMLDGESRRWIAQRIYAAWRSPSGDGIKLLFVTDEEVRGADHYKSLAIYLIHKIFEEYELRCDMACTDAAHATYVSYDPLIYWNSDATPVEYADLKDELSKEDNIDEAVSIDLRDANQASIFLDIAKAIRVEHYKVFRDLCSAVSRLGRDVLAAFYDNLYGANAQYLSTDTRRALSARDRYIDSFMAEHARVPLQYVVDYAVSQSYDMGQHGNPSIESGAPLFDISQQKKAIIDWMNERFAMFGEGSAILVAPRQAFRSVEVLAGQVVPVDAMTHRLRKVSDIRMYLGNKALLYTGGKGKMQSLKYFDLWVSSTRRRDISGIVCDPRQEPGISRDRGTYNEWRGFNISQDRLERVLAAEKRSDRPVCQPILDFIHYVIANESEATYEYIMTWLAEIIQNAGATNKPAVCLVLVSEEQRTGKGTFDEFIRDIIGPVHSTMLQTSELITGTFNQALQGRLLVTLDEAIYSGDKKAYQVMKSIIGGATLSIRPLFMAPYEVPNITRVLILSNNRHVVHAEKYDARYFVTEVSPRVREDIPYFKALRQTWIHGGKESFFNVLKNWEYKREDLIISKQRMSDIMRANRLGSMDAFDQWVSRCIHFAHIKARHDIIPLGVQRETRIEYAQLYDDYAEFCKTIHAQYEKTEIAFRQRLLGSGFATNSPGNIYNENAQRYMYMVTILPLAELHRKFPLQASMAKLPDREPDAFF